MDKPIANANAGIIHKRKFDPNSIFEIRYERPAYLFARRRAFPVSGSPTNFKEYILPFDPYGVVVEHGRRPNGKYGFAMWESLPPNVSLYRNIESVCYLPAYCRENRFVMVPIFTVRVPGMIFPPG